MSEFFNTRTLTAAKEHTCDICDKIIDVGSRYVRSSGKWNGEFFDYCYHDTCDTIIKAYGVYSGESDFDYDAILEFIIEEYCQGNCSCYDEKSMDYDLCAICELNCPKVIAWAKNYTKQ